MIIDIIAGARPNFMKVAALFAIAHKFPSLHLRLIHTGQHYDANMSDVFLEELGLPQPTAHLGVGSGSQAVQTAEIMTRYERWVQDNRPDMTLVVGDVNSTLACSVVAAKAGIRLAHVEAGLRSFDRRMPEEVNRVVTDSLSDLMFATEPSGIANLAREGRPLEAIHLVGHVMIDTLLTMKPKAEKLNVHQQHGLEARAYAYLTLHRPSNVDDEQQLGQVCEQVIWLAERLPAIFPVHPRTRSRMEASGWDQKLAAVTNLHLTEPLSYLASLSVMLNAKMVVTDSGGLQEESSTLDVPCLTLRDTTERPITVSEGTNTLIAGDWELYRRSVEQIIKGQGKRLTAPIPYWDGKAGQRILGIIAG